MTLISVTVPGLSKMILYALLSFIYLDILQTDKWLLPFIYSNVGDQDIDDIPLNIYFDENGFSSRYMIMNIGSTTVYVHIYMLIFAIMPILEILGKKFEK